MRNSLVTALVSCADTPSRPVARRFLRGLSCDELQFIAEFYGACILEEPAGYGALAERIAAFETTRGDALRVADLEHKAILLIEYLRSLGRAIAA